MPYRSDIPETIKKMNNPKLFFLGIRQGFQDFGNLIADVINFILLSLVYSFGVGLTSIAAKSVRKRFLELSLDRKKDGCWMEHKVEKQSLEDYLRQF